MKIKYQQLYSNDCGVAAIKNLLYLYGIDFNVNIDINENGTSLLTIKNRLEEYFFDVKVVSFEIDQIRNTKQFNPYIALLLNNDIGHYVVIYKKDKRFIYILDSLATKSYKLTYQQFAKIDGKKAVICQNNKKESFKLKNNKYLFVIPFLSLIESLFMLSTTILVQQIIDNGMTNAIIYIIVQMLLLFITTYRVKLFLKTYKKIDDTLIKSTLKGLYNLQDSYYDRYNVDEIYYRLFDAYSYKGMILSICFEFINDIILAICGLSLMFVYSYVLAIILLIILIPIVIISLKVFKKIKVSVEQRRIDEYNFISYYRDKYKNVKNDNNVDKKEYENESYNRLKKFQKSDYSIEKISNIKNLFLLYFQSFVISLIVILYFSKLKELLSIGSLVALINLVALVLQPILNICSNITNYSNMNLHRQRIKNIQDHIK